MIEYLLLGLGAFLLGVVAVTTYMVTTLPSRLPEPEPTFEPITVDDPFSLMGRRVRVEDRIPEIHYHHLDAWGYAKLDGRYGLHDTFITVEGEVTGVDIDFPNTITVILHGYGPVPLDRCVEVVR